jgi:type II restriction enzyme
MDIDIYKKYLKSNNQDDIVDEFINTLIDTNRGYKFFVDWNKIKSNVEKYKIELNILNSLIGSKNFEKDLYNLISKYPEVVPVIPVLIAVRELKFKVMNDFSISDLSVIEYDFRKLERNEEEIKKLVDFCVKTGIKYMFENIATKSLIDYLSGIEVGMDTNARKNRSGNAMELALIPFLNKIEKDNKGKYQILFQKKFKYLTKKFGIKVLNNIKDRKADFIILKNSQKVINIEVNFYSGVGSKPQEIVDSYITRQSDLVKNGFKFIWITDGYGCWAGQRNQIQKGFKEIDYILNTNFVRMGILTDILNIM